MDGAYWVCFCCRHSRTWTSGSFESVRWNAWVHRLDHGLYSHPSFWGNEVWTHVNSKGKIPSTGKFPQRRIEPATLFGSVWASCGQRAQTLPTSYSGPQIYLSYLPCIKKCCLPPSASCPVNGNINEECLLWESFQKGCTSLFWSSEWRHISKILRDEFLSLTYLCSSLPVEYRPSTSPRHRNRLVGLVVKASASRAEGPGFESRLRRDFFGVESYQWLKNWHSSGYPARRLAL